MPLLELDGISLTVPTGHLFQQRKEVLHEVTFSVSQGKAIAYLGPNGAGKTSTFRILCGLCRPDAGSVRFDGQEIRGGLPGDAVGFMPEQPYFYRHLTARELLASLGALSGMPASDCHQQIGELAERLNFERVLDQRLGRCSKGQIQRVGLAQAMMHRPRFLLLDEPMSGLDPLGRDRVKDVLRDAVRDGATLLFSSHILSDAEAICDAVIILNRGRVMYQGRIEDLVETADAWEVVYEGPVLGDAGFERQEQVSAHAWRVIMDSAGARDALLRKLLEDSSRRLLRVQRRRDDLESAFVRLIQQGEIS